MTRASLLVLALAACGDGVTVAGGPAQGGVGGATSTQGPATTATVSSTTATVSSSTATVSSTATTSSAGGAGGAGGEGGAGVGGSGGMGGALVPEPRLMTVQRFDGSPEVGVHVVGHDADGLVLDHQLTAADGTATVLAPDDGMITVGYELVRTLPDGNGGSQVLSAGRLHTLAPIGTTQSFAHRLSFSRTLTENAPMTLEVTATIPSADQALVFGMCNDRNEYVAPVGTTAYEVRGCPGEATFDVVVVGRASGSSIGRKIFEDIAHQPGQTTPLTVTEAELEPEPADHVFAVPAVAFGIDAFGDLRSVSTNFSGSIASTFATPLTDGVSAWIVQEYGGGVLRLRLVPTIPPTSSWTPPAMLQPWIDAVTTFGPQRPQVAWSYQGIGGSGDCLKASWIHTSVMYPAIWSLYLPAGTTTATYPAVPPAMAPLVPGAGAGINLYAIDAEKPGAGIVDIFAFEAEDHALSASQLFGIP